MSFGFENRKVRLLCGLVAYIAVAACSPSETFRFANEGKICLWPAGAAAEEPLGSQSLLNYEIGHALRVTVLMPTCLSSSCSKEPRATCEVKRVGPQSLEVTSEGSYREEGRTCSADCGFLVARCESPVLEAGSYTIRHGKDQLMLTVPTMTKSPCAGREW